jgi:hypothetical protein
MSVKGVNLEIANAAGPEKGIGNEVARKIGVVCVIEAIEIVIVVHPGINEEKGLIQGSAEEVVHAIVQGIIEIAVPIRVVVEEIEAGRLVELLITTEEVVRRTDVTGGETTEAFPLRLTIPNRPPKQ